MGVPYDPEHVTHFAETDFRGQRTRFGIKSRDRTRHMYVIGKSGVGKSTLLENMAIQDIQHGEGLAILDPHGSFAGKMLDYVPPERIKDVIYFAPFDTDNPISFNILEDVGADKRHFVASGLMSTFKKIWVDAWSARMEYILNNILLALLEYPNATILGVNRMLADKDYRKKVVENVTDPGVRAFWIDEFAKYGERYMQEAGAAIQNKIGQFVANPLVRNIIGQPTSSFDVRKVMDEQKILIIDLSKGRIGEQNTSLLGSMLITKIYLGAMSRAEETPARLGALPNFYFYVDEFQSFANETFADILAEARKYKLALIIAHQYIAQMDEKVRDAVFGNVGTTVSFRVGPIDAELMEKVFAPQFTANDLINLGMAQIYLTLLINDIGSPAFSARTLPPIPRPTLSYRSDCIEWSRETYAKGKESVVTTINEWYGPTTPLGEEAGERGERRAFSKNAYVPREEGRKNTFPSYPPRQQPFKKAFAEERDASPKAIDESSEGHIPQYARVKMPRQVGTSSFPEKPFVRRFTKNDHSETVPEKKETVSPREKAPLQESRDKETVSPALSALLSSLDFEKSASTPRPLQTTPRAVPPPEKKPTPPPQPLSDSFSTDEKPFRTPERQPVKTQERAATEQSKSVLRDALLKVMPQRATAPIAPVEEKTPLPSASLHANEVAHEEIKKILE